MASPPASLRPVKFKHHLIYYAARVLIALIRLLPYGAAGWCGRRFGNLVFFFSKREKNRTLDHLRFAYGNDLSPGEVRATAQSLWRRLGQNLFEVVQWLGWTPERIRSLVARTQGTEHLRSAQAKGKGVLVITAHLGNWELLGCSLGSFGEFSGVAQHLYDPRFDRLVTGLRTVNIGARMIKRGMALRGMLEALKDGHFLLALCDQDSGKDGVFVPFFGKQAWTQSGVVRIAQRTGAPLVPAFMVRGRDGQWEFHVEPEIPLPSTGDAEKDVVETVRRFTEVIENYVRAYPDQWVWMHERWKTRPPGEKQ